MDEEHPVKVLLAVDLAQNLLDDIRGVDPGLEIDALDRETIAPFWGRPPADESAQQRFAALMAETEVLYGMILSTEQARKILAAAPKMRWFQSASAGVDELIGAGFVERGVAVTTSSGVHSTPIGEFALHLMLMFAKQARRSLDAQREKRWERFTPTELWTRRSASSGWGTSARRWRDWRRASAAACWRWTEHALMPGRRTSCCDPET